MSEQEVLIKVLQAFAAVGAQWAVEELQQLQAAGGQAPPQSAADERKRR